MCCCNLCDYVYVIMIMNKKQYLTLIRTIYFVGLRGLSLSKLCPILTRWLTLNHSSVQSFGLDGYRLFSPTVRARSPLDPSTHGGGRRSSCSLQMEQGAAMIIKNTPGIVCSQAGDSPFLSSHEPLGWTLSHFVWFFVVEITWRIWSRTRVSLKESVYYWRVR